MKRSRNALLAIACCAAFARTVWGEQVVRSIDWQDLGRAGTLTSGTVVAAQDGGRASLRVVHKGRSPATLPLATIERPPITAARYALRGRVRYDNAAAGSHLEMWSHLGDGAFFSRSLAESGPMGRLEGSSGWRPFMLPFENREGGPPPQKLVFNLVLGGAGTVEIGPVDLIQFDRSEDLNSDSAAWWSDRQAGMLGAITGSVLGIIGAVIGWLGSTGRARGLVLGTLRVIAWMGIGALVFGVLAAGRGQPYAVYYPLLLVGTISAALGFSLPRSLTKWYEEVELRRMQALDA